MKPTAPPGLVTGTAGHIDHGKTSLIRALTGVDTDRLQEEKRRGISIDLGFAHMALPSGRIASFVDVPGHERFIKNMLAGASGVQAVLLVVAANESVMPQTREHFEICRLLGIESGLIALTKVDLATPNEIEATRRQVRELCSGSFLSDAAVVPVSTITGVGLNELRTQLDTLADRLIPKPCNFIGRLPVDRSFTLKGFGTVVTGTLAGEPLSTASTLVLHPGAKAVRVRGLQVHGQAVDRAFSGQRVAVNLSGVESQDIERGCILTSSDILEPSQSLGVALTWLPDELPPVARVQVLLHAGAAEIVAYLKMFDGTLGRLSLAQPALVFPGDRIILRKPSPARTIAGGVVVDAFPKLQMRRNRALERLQWLNAATFAERIAFLVDESVGGQSIKDLIRLTGRPASQIEATIRADNNLLLDASSGVAISQRWLADHRKRLTEFLEQFHGENPNRTGASLAAARLGLAPAIAQLVFADFSSIKLAGDVVALAGHRAAFTQLELVALSRMETVFQKAGFAPPAPADVLKTTNLDAQKSRTLLETLVKRQRLIRISQDLLFHADVIAHIRTSLAKQKGKRFSVPEFKEWTQISRKYAIPLLEYLDQQRVTRREGESRLVL